MDIVAHGGALDRAIAEFGGAREDWLDLSTGINPVAWPVPDLPPEVWQRLPDDQLMAECLDAARAHYGVPDGADVVAAPGTQAIIQWLPHLFNYLDRVTIVSPTYGEYAHAFHMAGAAVDTPRELPETGEIGPLVIFGQPNNPDGRTLPRERVAGLMNGAQGVRMAIADEAFADEAPEHSVVGLAGGPGLTVLKSFGKFFGLAGVRLGFAIGDPDVIASLKQMIGPWAVPGPALAIGARALADRDWMLATRTRLDADSRRLSASLERAGMRIVARTGLFVLAAHGDAAMIARDLSQRHVLVRPFDYAPEWLRFGLPGSDTEFERLDSTLAEIL